MSQHTQWIPVTAEGAEQLPGFRCDGCGQVKWQEEKPVESCELCTDTSSISTSYDNQGSAPLAEAPAPKAKKAARIPGLTKGEEQS